MNPEDPLANLHPLRSPAEIGWWPLAPGWWVLIILAVLILITLGYRWYRHRQRNRYRRDALLQLATIYAATEQDLWLSQTNALLKSVAILAFPSKDIAALSGTPWLDFLNTSGSKTTTKQLFPADFAIAVYSANPAEVDKDQLEQASRQWIANHRADL